MTIAFRLPPILLALLLLACRPPGEVEPEALQPTDGPQSSPDTREASTQSEMASLASEFSRTRDDVWIGGQPSSHDLQRLKQAGVALVIDLRTPDEDIKATATEATKHGMGYLNLPVDKAMAEDEVVARFAVALERSREAGEGVLLHCASGNRAGEVWALHQVEHGEAPATAIAEAEAAGTRDDRLERLRETLADD